MALRVRTPKSTPGRPSKGDRVFVPAAAPKALVDHVILAAESQGLTQNAYLCTVLEDAHGYPRSELAMLADLTVIRVDEVPVTTETAKLRCRLMRNLVEHIDAQRKPYGMDRGTWIYTVVAQLHGFDVKRPVAPEPYDPEYVVQMLPDLAPTGT